ncbi:MAG: PaaI family thioesterase [Elusimicrobia bacterium]|nr:PaaI family thioesterase [Elusimicrobiota bacterium]
MIDKMGWEPVQPFPFSAAREAFAGLTSEDGRVVMHYFLRKADQSLVATVGFGPRSEGAPGTVHGGSILTVLDEALGAASWLAGRPVLTVRLNTQFRKSLPIGANCLIETRLTGERHRLVFVEGTLRGADGVLYAEAQGQFMRLDPATQRRFFGRATILKDS